MCSFEGAILWHRGVVKWYHRGLQNLWWEFDSLHPCYDFKNQKCCVKSHKYWTKGRILYVISFG